MDPKDNYRSKIISVFFEARRKVQNFWFDRRAPMVDFRWLLLIFLMFLVAAWLWLLFEVIEEVRVLVDHPPAERAEDQRNIVQAIALAIAAIAGLLSAPIVLYRISLQTRQTETVEQGHITDRISKAVEQLGAEKTTKRTVTLEDGSTWVEEHTVPNLEVRLGGIYALERIAQDSLRDHIQVMEILCAYIRNNAPASEAEKNLLPPWPDWPENADDAAMEARNAELEERARKLDEWLEALPGPCIDIQAAITVIGRRTEQQIEVERRPRNGTNTQQNTYIREVGPEPYDGYALDLRKCCLRKADLTRLNLNHAHLTGSLIEGANLRQAKVERAVLRRAKMEGANLRQAKMERADLSEAEMERTNLGTAEMERALLLAAKMERANLGWAKMDRALLVGAKMERANLRGAKMEGANLNGAKMERADLRWAKMEGADLSEASLKSADLSDWTGVGMSLRSADFRDANNLWPEVVNSAFGVREGVGKTLLPQGISAPDHWHVATEAEDGLKARQSYREAYRSFLASLPAGKDGEDRA